MLFYAYGTGPETVPGPRGSPLDPHGTPVYPHWTPPGPDEARSKESQCFSMHMGRDRKQSRVRVDHHQTLRDPSVPPLDPTGSR